MLLFILFLVIPLIEISLFIAVGDEIGILSTLLLCVLTAVIGASLLRQQGLKTLFTAQKQMDEGVLPLREIFDGFCLAIAGATLITPGFFTDFIGFMLLLPLIRDLLWKKLPEYFDIETRPHNSRHRAGPDSPRDRQTIDVSFERVDEDENEDDSSDRDKSP